MAIQPVYDLDDFERSLLIQIRSYCAYLKTIRKAKKTQRECEELKKELAELIELERSKLKSLKFPADELEKQKGLELFPDNRGLWSYPHSY